MGLFKEGWVREFLNEPLSITIIAVLTALRARIYIDNHKREEIIKPAERIIDKVYQEAAGRDNVLSLTEKSQLLKSLGINEVIDETEKLNMDPYAKGNSVFVKVTAYAGFHNYRELGKVPLKALENYLENSL